MAGERKGKAYEALVYVALQDLVNAKKIEGPVLWNVIPKGMSIEPDFLTGSDPDSPKTVLLLSHCGSAKNSDMKMWRNLGELVEAKTVLPSMPNVYCILLGIMKADLDAIQQHAFDHFVWVRQSTHAWADELDRFVSCCVASFPKGKEAQSHFMRDELGKAPETAKAAYQQLKALLETIYQTKSGTLDKMWSDHRSRPLPAAPGARNTSIRRGASKLYLFPDHQEAYRCFRTSCVFEKPVGNLAPLALVERRPGVWFPAKDRDVLCCVKLLCEKDCLALFSSNAITSGFRLQALKVQESAILSVYANWCQANWKSLTTQANMKKTLLALHADPLASLSLPAGCSAPKHVWIMDVLGAIIRAGSNKSQVFGFSSFAKHPQAKSSMIGNMDVGTWTSCFMNQFFTRKAGFNPPLAAIDFTALVLSDFAKQAETASVNPAELERQYLTKEYEAVYLTHRGFEPLWGIISGQVREAKKIRIRTCYAEAAGLSGISGNCALAKVKNSLINWQSCSDAGRDHKKKELCGRAIGLRYHWNGKAFVRRPGVEKMILVLDGTWKQADLNALLRAGWDEIYYPDEMDQLAKAIV